MKAKILIITSYYLKTLFIVTVFITGMSGFVKCEAQTVVGKWERDLTKWYTIDKATGKQVPVSADVQKKFDEEMAKRDYKEILEMKSDGTYTSTVTAGGETKVHSEHYSVSGKNLDLNIPLVNGEKTTITIETLTSTQMTWDLLYMKRLTGVGYKRIGN